MYDNIYEKLKNLPLLPGVYIMKSDDGEVIYVGKSKALKNRVSQYFQNAHDGKVAAMVANIRDFEYIVTKTETEALVLECNLIKKYKPYYNILLKDSKQYPYIKITLNQPYPKISIARKTTHDGAKYFGPYTAGVARDTIEVIRKIFKVHTCRKRFPADIGKDRPCLNYHIDMCCAPCSGNITQQEYLAIYRDICKFLEGNVSDIIKRLKAEMQQASDALEFEMAAELRDKINRIRSISEKQNIIIAGSGDKDIIALKSSGDIANIQLLNVRDGRLIGRASTWLSFSLGETDAAIMADYITQYYIENQFMPREILVNVLPEGGEVIENWLSEKIGRKITLHKPQRGSAAELVRMAEKNAVIAVEERGTLKQAELMHNKTALAELSAALGYKAQIKNIEAYDISHMQGKNTVGSMVVYENGVRQPDRYRHFKIKSAAEKDDYDATREVITRRFRNYTEGTTGFETLPTLIFADGGMAHAETIKNAAQGCGVNVDVYGMVKDDKHRTRALITTDGEIVELSEAAFRLVCEIQEEVHRCAIAYHRKLRESELTRSLLDEIEGVGAKRKKALLREFGSVKGVKNASIAELAAVDGITAKLAEEIYKFFN